MKIIECTTIHEDDFNEHVRNAAYCVVLGFIFPNRTCSYNKVSELPFFLSQEDFHAYLNAIESIFEPYERPLAILVQYIHREESDAE